MKKSVSAGGIIYKIEEGQRLFLVVRTKPINDRKTDYWGFPKGHLESRENAEQAARREVKEETGVEAEILNEIGSINYIYTFKGDRIAKTVTLFLMKYLSGDIVAQAEEIGGVEWLTAAEVLKKLTFENDLGLFRKALDLLGDHHE